MRRILALALLISGSWDAIAAEPTLSSSPRPNPAFILCADISWVQQQEEEGRRFSDHGVPKDIFVTPTIRLMPHPSASWPRGC